MSDATQKSNPAGQTTMMKLISLLLLPMGITTVFGASTTITQNLIRGSALKCLADLGGGLPCEVWKSSVVLESISADNQNRKPVSSVQVLQKIIKEKGPGAMWRGCSARMVEGCLSGAVLLSSKEAFRKALTSSPVIRKRFAPATIGFVAGACGGACQAVVMTPCSLLVTAAAAGAGGGNVMVAARDIYERKGLTGFYRGSRAVAARQATNWASRQGFTELVRPRIGIRGIPGEIVAGCLGGAVSCWNTPFEVARIHSQTHSFSDRNSSGQTSGEEHHTMFDTMNEIVQKHGVGGLFTGVSPRIIQSTYQTVFLVTIPRIIESL